MPKISAEHPALAQLRELAQDETLFDTYNESQNWRVGKIDDATVAQAAVLMLFGVLDDVPAHTAPATSTVSQDLDVLIVMRSATLRKHAGQPAFPGGKIDPEDRERAEEENLPVSYIAALREAHEETGLDPAGVEILGEFEEIDLPVSNFRVRPVLGWWNTPSQVAAQDLNESSLVLRVPVADLLNPSHRFSAEVRRDRQIHRSPAFTVQGSTGEFVIWGFTGILLDRVFNRLGWSKPWNTQDVRSAPGHTPDKTSSYSTLYGPAEHYLALE